MTKPQPRLVMEGEWGRVVVRALKGRYHIKATRFDGDAIAEMRLAADVANLMQEAVRAAAHDPTLLLIAGPIRHVDDHDQVDR